MKKIITSILCCCMIMTAFVSSFPRIEALSDGKYVESGLVARYDGSLNKADGHDIYSNVWQDLSGNGNDLDLSKKTNSYFTKHGFVIDRESFTLSNSVLSAVNSNEFTVEVGIGEIYETGSSFTTFINSTNNDNFALFLRTDTDILQLKANTNPRPGKTYGIDSAQYHTLAVTFSLNSFIRLYIDGVLVSSEVPTMTVQSAGLIEIGTVASEKANKTEFRGVRVYSRALNATELTKNADSDRVTYITDTSPALPLIANVEHHLDNTDVYFNNVCYTGSECTFTSSSSAIKVSNGKITATATGIYDMTVSYGQFSKKIKAVVRGTDNYEFVLHSNDFSSSLPSDYRIVNGDSSKIYVSGGYLVVNGTGTDMTRVLLPSYLDSFGDYKITAVASINNTSDTSRWGSITFRTQNGNYPFYHMCFRQNASAANGVEFAKRNESNAWSVFNTSSYTSALTLGTDYTFTIKTCGSNVKEYINNYCVIASDSMADYNTGGIGFIANNSTIKVNKVTVTLNASSIPDTPYVTIAQPKTDVVGGICFSEYVTSKDKLNSVKNASIKPANAIFYINEKQYACTDSSLSTQFCNMEEIRVALGGKIMPTFYAKNKECAEAICQYLETFKISDVFIMSDSTEVLTFVKDRYTIARRVLDLTSEYKGKPILSKEACLSIRTKATNAWASIVVLPACCTNFNVIKCLQDMIMTTWLFNDTGSLNSVTRAFDLIARGTFGVISDNTQLLYNVTKNYMGSNVLTRAPLNIGHRGLPSKAPENTLESAKLAYSKGADCIEVDIYLTTDNKIVIMHDANTSRTCGTSWNVEEHTLAELKTLVPKNNFSNYPNVTIPTLEEYYQEFKGKDVRIFVEIKSYKKEIITYLKQLTEQYGMTDQVSVIAFGHTGACQTMKEVWPEMSLGYLTSNIATGGTSEAQVKNVLNTVQSLGSTYNPQYPGHTAGFLAAANMRGLTSWPWTYADNSDSDNYLLYGADGLTTNCCDYFENYGKTLKVTKATYNLKIGETHTPSAYLTLYNRKTTDVGTNANSRIIILEGGDIATVSGNKITVKSLGKVTYAVEYTQTMQSGSKYTLVTTPVTLYTGTGVKGDVDGNGKVTIADLIMLDAYMANKTDKIDTTAADLNGDGKITVDDGIALMKIIKK